MDVISLKERVLSFVLVKGSKRTKNIKTNAYLSLLLMVASNIVSFLFIPVVIGMIEPIRYGIWITVNSVLNWFYLADFGLGGGLRTRLAQALAAEEYELAKRYVSTGYAFLIGVVVIIIGAFIFLQRYIDWVKVFNAPHNFANELSVMMLYVVSFFFAKFSLQLLGNVLIAFQMTFISPLINFLSSLLSLSVIYFLFQSIKASLFLLGFIYTLSPVIVLLVASIYFYMGKLKEFRPRFSYVDIKCLKPVMNLGVLEFIDRVSFIVIVSATNILISHIGSPTDVIPYNVTLRFMGLLVTSYSVITEPFTPAFSEAFIKNEHGWIKRVFRKTNFIGLLMIGSLFLSIPVAKPAIEFVLKGKVNVPYTVIILVAILVSNRILSSVYGRFLTGIGIIRLIVLVTAISATIYLPLVYAFSHYFMMGVISVITAQIIVEFPIALTKYLQTQKILSNSANGLWAK